jgi:hypothetical protein
MVRVIGRIDLADEVQRALGAAGIESYVVTAGPMAAAEATGQDRSEADGLVADVLAHELGICAGIKRKARHRPVVLVTPAKLERIALAHMRGAFGPDAHVVWPASGEAVRSGIARAVAAAETVRPRFPGRSLPGAILFALATLLLIAPGVLVVLHADTTPFSRAAIPLGTGLLGAGSLLGARYSLMPRWNLIFGVLMILSAAVELVLLVVL